MSRPPSRRRRVTGMENRTDIDFQVGKPPVPPAATHRESGDFRGHHT